MKIQIIKTIPVLLILMLFSATKQQAGSQRLNCSLVNDTQSVLKYSGSRFNGQANKRIIVSHRAEFRTIPY